MSLPLNGSSQYLYIADAAVLTFPDDDWSIGGWDEGNAAGIEAQLPLWRAAREMGCDVFVSAGPNEDALWDRANALVGYPFLNALGFDQSLDRWESYGATPWHTGPSRPENPDYQRRRYGMKAYRHGFAGVCPFAWQFGYGSPLDDTDSPEKDMLYAYPDADGKPIETIQLAALRQAVNDTAYAARADVKPDPGDHDLDELRWELILKILEKV